MKPEIIQIIESQLQTKFIRVPKNSICDSYPNRTAIFSLNNLGKIDGIGIIGFPLVFKSTIKYLRTKLFEGIKYMNLQYNWIASISFISEFVFLEELNLGHNKISDIKSFKHYKHLKKLDLSSNLISNINSFSDCSTLKLIKLRNNNIFELPENVFFNQKKINSWHSTLIGNKVSSPPIEIIQQGNNSIERYFKSVKVHNKELKIIFLGNTTAGKTSVVQYLTNKIYPPKRTTHGINLTTWQPKDTDFTVTIWDFGGQEYYHATHRLFLTNNAFYIILWEKNNNETAIIQTDIFSQKGVLENKKLQQFHYKYWLKLVRKQFAPNADIITVQNKIDLSDKEIINQDDVKNYKIKDQFQISVKETAKEIKRHKRRFEDFEEELKEFIANFIKSHAPEGEDAGKIQRYIYNIRESIRNEWNDDYLTINDFKRKAKIAAKKDRDDIDDKDLEITLKYLHDTGILLYYGFQENMPNSVLQKYVFINPNYVTDTIYKILDENNVQRNGGKFDFRHVKSKVSSITEAELFLALMQSPNFELVFTYEGAFYASQFLQETNSVIDYQKSSLEFAFSLRFPNYYSTSFITRFISRYGIQAKNNAFCRFGIILKRDNIDFYISADINSETITVKTTNEGKKHRFIRNIYDIFLEFAGVDFWKDGEGDYWTDGTGSPFSSSSYNNIELTLDGKEFVPLKDIEKYNLHKYNIDRLFKPRNYNITINGNNIEVKGDGNIILQDLKGETTTINVRNLSEFQDKLSDEHSQILELLKVVNSKIDSIPAFDIKEQIMDVLESNTIPKSQTNFKKTKKIPTKLKDLQKALLSAFPNPSELNQMVRYAVNENIHAITRDDNLTVKTYELIMWAKENNKIKELIVGAKEENTGNIELRNIDEKDYV